jgi:cytochrome b
MTTTEKRPVMNKILVWDLPVRIGHWLMVGGFALAWVTGGSESLRLIHVFAGGTVVAAAVFRLVWGVIGSRHARFASFVRGPRQTLGYLNSLLRLAPPHSTGHNPVDGWIIVLLLSLALSSGASGWLAYQEIGGEWLGQAHQYCTNMMLTVAGVHVLSILLHNENLVRAMLTGRKLGRPHEAIGCQHRLTAALLLIWAALGAWWLAR